MANTKTPFLSKAQAEAIAADVPTPFHVYDEAGIRENARKVHKAFAWNPGFREYFAVKATPTPALLDILKQAALTVQAIPSCCSARPWGSPGGRLCSLRMRRRPRICAKPGSLAQQSTLTT